MRLRFTQRLSVKKLSAGTALLLGLATLAGAQMPDGMGGGAGAFAGGQMVRGTVTAVTADKITLKTDTGDVYQVAVSANTRLTKARAAVKAIDIKAGDGIGAMGVMDVPTKTVHAVFVTVVDAEEVKKAKDAMGKTVIAGKITAIDEVKLTVLRTDGVSQVIEVDENTSFKRGGRGMAALLSGGSGVVTMGGGGMMGGGPTGGGPGGPRGGAGGTGAGSARGESITLADVKVGDTVAGQGTVKNGVFVPTELGVSDAAAAATGGQRRRRPGGEGGPAAASPSSGSAGAGVGGTGAAPPVQ